MTPQELLAWASALQQLAPVAELLVGQVTAAVRAFHPHASDTDIATIMQATADTAIRHKLQALADVAAVNSTTDRSGT